ncbi:MAG: hypothetical protein ACWA45_03865 [Flavobacteriales bacterium]
MKKILLLLIASTLVFSCTKDVTVADATADLSTTLTQYDDSNLGTYKGVYTSNSTLDRGVLEINVIPENYPTASLKLVNGQVITFKASQMIQDGDAISNLEFRSATSLNGQTSFKMSADLDGNNVQISEVMINGTSSSMAVMHDTSRAPVVPITGVMACDDCAAHPVLVTGDTGTFSLVYAGDGSADDSIMTMISAGGASLMVAGGQSGCTDNGDGSTTCGINGAGIIGTNNITYNGTHTYRTDGDCSEAAGTWALSSGNHGDFTGTFISDVTCGPPPPANDLCANAIDITCGGTETGSTVGATDEDAFGGAEVWYRVIGTTSGDTITASLCDGGTDYDSRLTVYDMCGGTLLTQNDDFCGLQSEVSWVSDGSNVMVGVDAFGSGTGNYSLAITCTPPPPACTGQAYIDSGGLSGDYAVNENTIDTFDVGAGNVAQASFASFDIESTWDFMYFYDGADETAPQIMTSDGGAAVSADRNGGVGFTGTDLDGDSVTATGQFLTIQFISDGSVTHPGWDGCIDAAPTAAPTGEGNRRTVTLKKHVGQTPEEIAKKKAIMRKMGLIEK